MAATILVPLDSSRFGEHALPVAVGIARRTGARLHLVHCFEPPLPPLYSGGGAAYDPQLDRMLRDEKAAYLARVADRVQRTCGVAVRTELLSPPTVPTLVSYASDAEVDLIVMTTHGRGGISRAWLGSVADALVRRTSVPVLLLRPRDEEVVITCEPQTSHMLIPLDGSELSEGILAPAIGLAQLSGAHVTLLQVIEPQQSSGDSAAERRAALSYLEGIAREHMSGLEVDVAVEEHESPAVAILEYAALHGADLIALATHGRGGWSRVALGSVADKVVRGTMMPVLLYRPPAVGAGVLAAAGGLAEMKG
jgi:nucleotide-binding universal stress UspA family protein